MQDFEKLGLFYLGRPYDVVQKTPKEGLVLYDSKDLVTHAVCVGMTGSGKTGLCLNLLEEAAIDGVPIIAIDPKGDVSNLLLTFPNLEPSDFLPWVNADDARRKDMVVEEYAAAQAERWKRGLAEWGQDGNRIKRLRDAASFAIYTPGSTAGLPLSILKSFGAPPSAVRDDSELLHERVETTATSLLTLAGVDADPVRSREHVLVSTILGQAWKEGRDLDLAELIQQIQRPPVTRIGVLDLDAFYPESDRFALAMQLNQLLAAPGFQAWLEGDPLDVDRLLYTKEGKPRVSIISIAHLNDTERMFFVSLLLNEVLGWMRTQSGTTSLRAILYMDEIFGYFPPVANPPAKAPLLTLLKQARAFGLGVVLATQNPVDLDYKGLSNAGTWFIGRLQTDRDKARLLDGLEGVSGTSTPFDRQAVEELIASLGTRVFLMHNVHEPAPLVFETRWAMSYLRGPLTRDQIRTLMADERRKVVAAAPAEPKPTAAAAPASRMAQAASSSASRSLPARPVLPPDVPQFVVPVTPFDSPPAAQGRPFDSPPAAQGRPGSSRGDTKARQYEPRLYAAARIHFTDPKLGVDESRDVAVLVPIRDAAVAVDWAEAEIADLAPSDLERDADQPAMFEALPAAATKPKSYEKWRREFSRWVASTQKLDLLRSDRLAISSSPNEPERDFRIRLQTAGREARDAATEKLRQKYAVKVASLQERKRRAEQTVGRETEQASQQKVQTAVSFGATVLGALFGRKAVSATTLGRATTAARGVGRTMKEQQDISRAQQNVDVLTQQLSDLEAQITAEADAVASTFDPTTETLRTISLKPKTTQIAVQVVALAWTATS